jgi:hypothetical protein
MVPMNTTLEEMRNSHHTIVIELLAPGAAYAASTTALRPKPALAGRSLDVTGALATVRMR